MIIPARLKISPSCRGSLPGELTASPEMPRLALKDFTERKRKMGWEKRGQEKDVGDLAACSQNPGSTTGDIHRVKIVLRSPPSPSP